MKTKFDKPLTRFRGSVSTGLSSESKVSREGGTFGVGYLEGFSVITKGEALGHGLWIDEKFISDTDLQLRKATEGEGVKSRYTHPGLSADGLSKGLGRVKFTEGVDSQVFGRLDFWKSSRKGPDGDLADHVLTKAEEDPKSFGSSIVFARDLEAEKEFALAHGAEEKFDPFFGPYLDFEKFESPDPDNVENIPHTRLGTLIGCDIVDDPAANPDGLFSRDASFDALSQFADFIFDGGDRPSTEVLDVDPDRAKSFFRKYFTLRGIEMKKRKFSDDPTPDEEAPAKPETSTDTDPGSDNGGAPEGSGDPSTDSEGDEGSDSEDEDDSSDADSSKEDGRTECSRYVKAFGAKGGVWFSEGLSFEEAAAKFNEEQDEEFRKLKAENEALKSAGDEPLSSDTDEGKDRKRAGFASHRKKNFRPVPN